MKKRSIFTVSLIIILSLCLTLTVGAVVDPTDDFYVNDYSGVLTAETKQMISDTNGYLEQNCNGAQIVVVTIEYLDTYKYADEYAVNLFNTWGVGGSADNNGMLLLLVTEEGKGWLTTGAGISDYFDSNTVDMYLDRNFWFMFDNGEFDEAVSYVFKELVYWYEGQYGCVGGFDAYYNPDPGYDDPYYEDDPYYRPTEERTHWGFFAVLGAILAFLFRNTWILFGIILLIMLINADRRRYRAYYMSMGIPIPRYHFWYMWGPRPHRTFVFHNDHRGPRPPRGGGPRPPRGGGGFGGGSHMGGGGFGGGGFGGGGFGGGGHMGGGGFSGGGGGGRR